MNIEVSTLQLKLALEKLKEQYAKEPQENIVIPVEKHYEITPKGFLLFHFRHNPERYMYDLIDVTE